MEKQIRDRLVKISKNLNGNHERSIKELGEVIDDIKEVQDNLKEKRKLQKRHNNIKIFFVIMIGIAFVLIVGATINYKINGENKLVVGENETLITNVLTGLSPTKLREGIQFLNQTDSVLGSIYNARFGEIWSNVPQAFEGTLISQTNIKNAYGMEGCHWDNDTQLMIRCLNEGVQGRASTTRRSTQIIGNITKKENDENFTLCEGAKYVDCSTDLTGADFFNADDDIEAVGSIYSQENFVADGNISAGENIIIEGDLEVSGVMTGTLSLGCEKVNITDGNITYSAFYTSVLGEGGSNDDLDNINGGSEGDVINIFPTDSGSDIILKDGTGNLDLGSDCALKSIGTKAELRKSNGGWKLIVCLT